MGIEVRGLEELSRSITTFSRGADGEIDEALDEAAEHFISVAQEYVRVDKGNLRDSIGILSTADGHYGGRSIRVGVDRTAPGTRAPTVDQYADIIHDLVPYIDIAADSTEDFLKSKVEKGVDNAIGKLFGGIGKSIGKFFSGLFGR